MISGAACLLKGHSRAGISRKIVLVCSLQCRRGVKLFGYLICLIIALTGCASAPLDRAAAMATWAEGMGGELHDQRFDRLTAAANGLQIPPGIEIRLHLLDRRAVAAYSWPSGDVYVCAGLVDAATDEEIRAAIAHEVGHLLKDAGQTGAVSLRGGSLQDEAGADRLAVELLASGGHSRQALVSVLSKVSAASSSGEVRRDIAQRIKRIHAIPG